MGSITYRKGFTIVELVVIIAVIGILAAIGMVSYSAYIKRAARTEAEADLRQAIAQIEKYKAETGGYPTGNTAAFVASLRKSSASRTYTSIGAANGTACLSTKVMKSTVFIRQWIPSGALEEGQCT